MDPFAKHASGFESFIPHDGSQDLFFSSWLSKPETAAEFLTHGGEDREPLTGDPRIGAGVSAILHVALVLFLLIDPSFDFFDDPSDPSTEVAELDRSPLVMFFEEPPPPEVTAVPLVPVQPVPQEATPAAEPPQVADNRLLIPKAMLAPPEDEVQEFMNDLPFSQGNTEEFYTQEEVKDPGAEGATDEVPEPDTILAPETGEDARSAEASTGEDNGNDGSDVDPKRALDGKNLGELLFGQPSLREQQRARADIPPPPSTRVPDTLGEGGENGRFTDIRRFLANSQFHNPDGGLVANTNNTLYYNDKGANFVPWIARLIAEVKRNWFVPQNIAWNHGHVAIRILVDRGGNVLALETLVPSGVASFDVAAAGAIRGSRLMPLPADFPDDRFEIILVFWYNERPYDLFG